MPVCRSRTPPEIDRAGPTGDLASSEVSDGAGDCTPATGALRLETGSEAGDRVGIDYDPMLAKLIVWADTREHGLERMLRALDEYHVGGIKTNIPLFRLILNDPGFRRGELHTGYLDELLKNVQWDTAPPAELTRIAALIASRQSAGDTARPTMGTSSRWLAQGREDMLR